MFDKIREFLDMPQVVKLLIAQQKDLVNAIKSWTRVTNQNTEAVEAVLEALEGMMEETPPAVKTDWSYVPVEDLPTHNGEDEVDYLLVIHNTYVVESVNKERLPIDAGSVVQVHDYQKRDVPRHYRELTSDNQANGVDVTEAGWLITAADCEKWPTK